MLLSNQRHFFCGDEAGGRQPVEINAARQIARVEQNRMAGPGLLKAVCENGDLPAEKIIDPDVGKSPGRHVEFDDRSPVERIWIILGKGIKLWKKRGLLDPGDAVPEMPH